MPMTPEYGDFLEFIAWQRAKEAGQTPNRFYNKTDHTLTITGDSVFPKGIVTPGDWVELIGGTFNIVKVTPPEPHKCVLPVVSNRTGTLYICADCGKYWKKETKWVSSD